MIVWQLSGDGVDPKLGASLAFFGMQGDAKKAKTALKKSGIDADGPTKVVCKNRDDLIALLAHAMKSVDPSAAAADDSDSVLDDLL